MGQIWSGAAVALLAIGSAWVGPTSARAQDEPVRSRSFRPLDTQLSDAIHDAQDDLLKLRNDEGAQTFAVLPFAVKQGDGDFGSDPADKPFGRSLGQRVERAMQLQNPGTRDDRSAEDPFDLILDPFEQLQNNGFRNFDARREADRKKVAARKFDLAVSDSAAVQADIFLTGEARFSPEDRDLEIQIMYFTKDDPSTLHEFGDPIRIEDLENDLAAMSELGEGYTGSALRTVARREDSRARFAIDDRELEFPVQVRILYDGRPQVLEEERGASEESHRRRVAEPREGQEVKIRLKNTTNERIGVVLMVNGKNTLYDQEGAADRCSRWVLEPNKEYEVAGFYPTLDELRPFLVLSDEESEERYDELGGDEFAGLISVYVFKSFSGDLADLPTPSTYSTLHEDRDEPASTYSELAQDSPRGLITEGFVVGADLQKTTLGPAVEFGCMIIRYYERGNNGGTTGL